MPDKQGYPQNFGAPRPLTSALKRGIAAWFLGGAQARLERCLPGHLLAGLTGWAGGVLIAGFPDFRPLP